MALGLVLGVGGGETAEAHGPPEGERGLEVGDALGLRHRTEHYLVRPLSVIDQDEQNVPVGPLGDLLAARPGKIPPGGRRAALRWPGTTAIRAWRARV